jgi:hypothetical protein
MNKEICEKCGGEIVATASGNLCLSCQNIQSSSRIKVIKKAEKYRLKHSGGEKIEVDKLEHDNRITINDGEELVFIESDPKRVRRIGELLIRASNIS